VPLALTALAAALYRDPQRETPQDAQVIYSPADGVIAHIGEVYEHRFMHTDCLRITFLSSPFDVPICRSPVSGDVRLFEHVAGENLPVQHNEAPERNERLYVGIQSTWGPVLVMQMAGPLGRHIRPQVQLGDQIEAGARIGMVRFGSRTDLIIQRDALALELATGQRVTGGQTRLGQVVPL
jgi:phosphatidylserine decarboxylase